MADGHNNQDQTRAEQARAVALFRYSLIREPADARLSTKQRGRLVRQIAAREHAGPFGKPVRISRETIDRWIRAWRAGGFDALVPSPRQVEPRTPAEVRDLAAALKREAPARTAAQVAAILRAHGGWAPHERTLQRLFVRLELNTRPDGTPPAAFGRFEADAPNVRWTGDGLHGPVVAGGKTVLCAFIDDHSRLLTGYRWARHEDTVRLEGALRAGVAARGVPASTYLDNGSAMVDAQLLRACASLGIHLVHSRPGQPAGRGKIERFFRTVREQFLVEIGSGGTEPADMVELNSLFTAWVETVYHRRVHSETGQSPLERFQAIGTVTPPTPQQLHEAFLWSEWRTVTKTATVSLHGNVYEVDTALVGRRVELVFDPFDLTDIDIRWQHRPMGKAVPQHIGRHVHHKARPDDTAPPAAPTGIDYLHLIEAAHTAELTARLRYSRLPDDQQIPGELPGQLTLPGTDTTDTDTDTESQENAS